MKTSITAIVMAIVGVALALLIIGGVVAALNVVPWALWNFAIAPLFGWPALGFWKIFFICWAISFTASLFRASK